MEDNEKTPPPQSHVVWRLRAALERVVALRGYRGDNSGRVSGYRVASDIAERALQFSRLPNLNLYGPYGWLIKPVGLAEDAWRLSEEPSENPDEEISVALFAEFEQALTNQPSQEAYAELEATLRKALVGIRDAVSAGITPSEKPHRVVFSDGFVIEGRAADEWYKLMTSIITVADSALNVTAHEV